MARGELRQLLEDGHQEGWLDRAELALSELVTNALVHGGSEVDLDLSLDRDRLRVEVADGSPHFPALRDFSPLSSTGRGLRIVDELVDLWDVGSRAPGKVVWFEVWSAEALAERLSGADTPQQPQEPRRDAVRVELPNFPLVLHAAWQEHASALLRERLLVGDEPDEDATMLIAHAGASDAMSLLFEQAPVQPPMERPDEIMVAATEPRVSLRQLVIEVPPSSLAHFEILDQVLEETIAMANAGRLLAPPTQPEVREFRRWVCREVRSQATEGRTPDPWASTLRHAPRAVDEELDWDPAPVSTAPQALLAADDTGHVVAVSRSALDLLGYADASQLCGQRLLRVVPDRYHQAHIAGLTQHMTNGRRPLLGAPVTVPVLRADGSETEMDLLVEAHPLPSGRRVFVATLGPPGSMHEG